MPGPIFYGSDSDLVSIIGSLENIVHISIVENLVKRLMQTDSRHAEIFECCVASTFI